MLREGNVWVWGFRGSGQQGNGTSAVDSTASPRTVNTLSNIVEVTGSAYTLVAIDSEGRAYGWGQNLYGAAGVGQTGIVDRPRQIPFPAGRKVEQVAAGEYFFIARLDDGSVWTWGHNLYGQLGNGNFGNQPMPIRVNLPAGQTARLIGAAYEGAFVVTNQNRVYAWGDNEASGLGFTGTIYGVQQIHRSPVEVTALQSYASNMTYIAGGNGWGQALLENGTVIGWGLRASLGRGITSVIGTGHHGGVITSIATNVTQMHSRYVGTIALTSSGEVLTWGQTEGSAFPSIYGASVTTRTLTQGLPAGTSVLEIGGGKEHVYYVTSDNQIWGAGYGALNKLSLTGIVNRSWPGVRVNLP